MLRSSLYGSIWLQWNKLYLKACIYWTQRQQVSCTGGDVKHFYVYVLGLMPHILPIGIQWIIMNKRHLYTKSLVHNNDGIIVALSTRFLMHTPQKAVKSLSFFLGGKERQIATHEGTFKHMQSMLFSGLTQTYTSSVHVANCLEVMLWLIQRQVCYKRASCMSWYWTHQILKTFLKQAPKHVQRESQYTNPMQFRVTVTLVKSWKVEEHQWLQMLCSPLLPIVCYHVLLIESLRRLNRTWTAVMTFCVFT